MATSSFRAPVLVYLMIGGALEMREDDYPDGNAWERMSDALDRVWFKQLTDYERLMFNYDTRIAIAEELGEVTC